MEFITNLFSNIPQLLLTIPIVLFSLSFHEFSHALCADKLGDPTAKNMGRLTLNPLKHLDLLGTLCMIFFGIGWANPVPINCGYFKNPKRGMAITALAGPTANLILSVVGGFFAVLTAFITGFLPEESALAIVFYYIYLFFYLLHYLNLYLALFNLIPIPPFDGSRILFSFLPDRYYFGVMRYERYIQVALLIALYLGIGDGLISAVAMPISDGIMSLFIRFFSLFIPVA